MGSSEKKQSRQHRLRICLAASGGGHIRQLLDLEPVWSKYDYYFASEDTALSRSLSSRHPVQFLCHFAFGQIKYYGLTRAIRCGVRNFWESLNLVIRNKPDVIISTGAGTVFFLVLLAKLLGAKFILIETLARFESPSIFSRMSGPFADYIVVQSSRLAQTFPHAMVCDPLEVLEKPRPAKKPLLFATVGVTLPFDRMIQMVLDLKDNGEIPEDLVLQTGIGSAIVATGVELHESLSFERIQEYLREADIVICHGGTGSVVTALREGCRTIVVPRLFENGEHYDNHQAEITNAFSARGLVFSANSLSELSTAIKSAREANPKTATTNPAKLIEHLSTVLAEQAAIQSSTAHSNA